MSTVNELIALVRDITDLDEADLPTPLVKSFIRDGYDRMINLERRWPFFESSTTFDTVAEQRDYALSDIGGGTFREITSLVDTSMAGNRLRLTAIEDAERVWNASLDTSSRPLYFVEWANSIKLYPKPDTVYPISVRGYRKPTYEWLNDSNLQVDCDDRLHTALAYYAISQAYKRQEDNEMSTVYKQSYEEAVMLARKDLMRTPAARPVVLSGGGPAFNERYWLQQLGRSLGQ